MRKDEIIEKKIKVETEKYKIHLWVVIALVGGTYALFIKYDESIFDKILFFVGLFFLIGFLSAVVKSHLKINFFFSKLEKKN